MFVPIIIDVVFAIFQVSLLPCSHFIRFSKSLFMEFVLSSILLKSYAELVSSAKMVTFEYRLVPKVALVSKNVHADEIFNYRPNSVLPVSLSFLRN